MFTFLCVDCRCTEVEATGFLARRLSSNHMSEEFASALLHVDAAAEVLEQYDEEKLEEEQEAHKKRSEEQTAFRQAFKAHQREVAERADRHGGRRGGGGGAAEGGGPRGGARGARGPTPRLPATIEQSTAKKFLPEGGTIWRGLTRGEWCGHFAPNPRIRSKWEDFPDGESGAMRCVLRRLWMQYADRHGFEYPACCPFADRLADAPAEDGA